MINSFYIEEFLPKITGIGFLFAFWIVVFVDPLSHKSKKGKLKCKLLRRVHRQYKIYWCPDGVYLEIQSPGYFVESPKLNKYFTSPISKEFALAQAKNHILQEVRRDYAYLHSNKKRKPIKVWH